MRPTSLCSVTLIAFALCGCGETAKTKQPAGKTKDAASNSSPKAKDASNNKTGAGNDKKPAVPIVETAKGKIKIILFSKNELVIYKDGEDDLKFDVAPTAKITLDDQEAKFTELRVDQIAEVVYLKENQKNMAVTIRAFKEPVTKQGSLVVGPIPVIGGGGNKKTKSGASNKSLKDQIVGKWTTSFTVQSAQVNVFTKMTIGFATDANWTQLIETTSTVAGVPPATSATSGGGTYKVINDNEIEMTTKFRKTMVMGQVFDVPAGDSATTLVVITGDELNFGNQKDAAGKPYAWKRVN